MNGEIINLEEEQQESEKEWEIYWGQLVERVPGEPGEEGREELKRLWEGRKKIEERFFSGEIPGPYERTDENLQFTREWLTRNEGLLEQDVAFSEAYDIVVDESG